MGRAFAVLVCAMGPLAGCSSEGGADVAVLQRREFDRRIDEICAGHERVLDDEVFGRADVLDLDQPMTDDEVEADLEATRRRLVDAKRDLLDQLRRIEPADRASHWRAAVDAFERAIEDAADGPAVDVTDRDLGRSVERLVDRFGLDVCF